MPRLPDPLTLPGTHDPPERILARASPLSESPGRAYVERRGIPIAIADAAGVRYIADFAGRTVWLAFDAGRSGDAEAARLSAEVRDSQVYRMPPPGRSKDWNTALVKRGPTAVARWVQHCLTNYEVTCR